MKQPFTKLSEPYRKYFSHVSEKVQIKNAVFLYRFCTWYDKSPKELIEEFNESRDRDRYCKDLGYKVEEWYTWLKTQVNPKTNKRYEINTIRSYPNGIRAFCKRWLRPLILTKGKIPKSVIAKGQHKFSQDDLRKCFYYGDTIEKSLISLAVSVGYGAEDFLTLECEAIAKLVNYAKKKGFMFVEWINDRMKTEGLTVYSVLTPEAIESLSEYLELLKKRFDGQLPRYLWSNGDKDGHIDNDTLNRRFRRLVSKSNIILKGKVSFHLIRKFTYTTLCRVNPIIADLIVGKSVDESKLTYLTDIENEVARVFKQAYNFKDGKGLSLNGELTGTSRQKRQLEIKQLQDAIIQIQKQFVAQTTLNEVLTKRQLETNEALKRLHQTLKTTFETQQHTIQTLQTAIKKLQSKQTQ